jgi:putative FmdB family regulatory protein
MPIYEFKCLKYQECIGILVMVAGDDQVQMKCTRCGAEELERILSSCRLSFSYRGNLLSGNWIPIFFTSIFNSLIALTI